jgi:hypothetical protein
MQIVQGGENNYSLTITATDQGTISSVTPATVLININDRNDNSPIFPFPPFTGSVAEDAVPGTIVQTSVLATDLDAVSSGNGLLTYQILDVSLQPSTVFSIFPNGMSILEHMNCSHQVMGGVDVSDHACTSC